jgi:hypothetical protein
MNNLQSEPRIERADEEWRYSIDVSHAPAYVLCTVQGTPSQAMIERGAMDMLEIMDSVVGQDAPFCPVIADLCKLGSAKVGVATFQWASSRALRRISRVIVLFDPDLLTRRAYAGFMRIASLAMPRVEIAYSYDEAFERLGVEGPPPEKH